MDTSRTLLSPGSTKRRRDSSSGEHLPPGHQQSQQQTSLPSIRQLHPYLPPSSGMPQHISTEPSAYGYPGSSHYAPHPGQDAGPSHSLGASQRDSGIYGAGDSEAEDLDQHSPPKKKRRRQALSCTECKRRKIKCDRTQPCTPCTRRGEEAGCQWHIVEPVEKYVTKAEFDELKTRYEQLEAFVRRNLPVGPATHPSGSYYQMGVPQGIPGVVSEAVQSYNPGTSGGMAYIPSMMHPPTYQQQHMDTSPQAPMTAPNRYMKSEGTQSPNRHAHPSPMGLVGPSTSPIMAPAHQSPSLSRHRVVADSSSPSASNAVVKTSALSLASITSPYHPDQQSTTQSKNCHAQTLILGERLRPGSEDPTKSSVRTRRQALVRLLAIPAQRRRRYMSIAQLTRQRASHRPHIIFILDNTDRRVGSVIQHRVPLLGLGEKMPEIVA